MPNIHNKQFTEETQLKLEIFKGYIREWIPVFLTSSERNSRKVVNIFDFFAGPGQDINGNDGSPIMILRELISFFKTHSSLIDKNIIINIHFNDKKQSNIKRLKHLLDDKYNEALKGINVFYSTAEFLTIFKEKLDFINDQNSANLIILDQYGVKQVTPNILKTLTNCPYTDLLFFISSSVLRRFANEESMNKYIDIPASELKIIPHKQIHRRVCEAYQRSLGTSNYFLTPFSIKKGSAIYGVIFGSQNLRGLEKFLTVCWDNDRVTGEANYDIDDDIQRYGQLALFDEDKKIKKQDEFKTNLLKYIEDKSNTNAFVTNHEIRRFMLRSGFLSKHTNEILRELYDANVIEVINPYPKNYNIMKRSFYLSNDEKKTIHIKKK